jgi:hypothetical protein
MAKLGKDGRQFPDVVILREWPDCLADQWELPMTACSDKPELPLDEYTPLGPWRLGRQAFALVAAPPG